MGATWPPSLILVPLLTFMRTIPRWTRTWPDVPAGDPRVIHGAEGQRIIDEKIRRDDELAVAARNLALKEHMKAVPAAGGLPEDSTPPSHGEPDYLAATSRSGFLIERKKRHRLSAVPPEAPPVKSIDE